MKVHQLKSSQILPISLEEAWDFFNSPENLNEITPNDINFKIANDVEKLNSAETFKYFRKLKDNY